jgi:hypothetical protein
MKKLLIGLSLLALTASASANDFFGGNNGEWKMGPNGPYYEESDWPEWTPMYWMDEMMNSFDDKGSNGGDNGFMGGMPFMGNGNNNMPFMGNNSNMPFMGGNNNGYPAMPYGAAPMPYGAPMMAPMPMQAMPMQAPMPMALPVVPPAPAAATPGPTAN